MPHSKVVQLKPDQQYAALGQPGQRQVVR